ncbi:MAG: methyltransferase domain-containing protein [Candidatus Tectomicrobia bacterium]|nr:methyltransferase domain-containing protein [Candidatus Tectomicrobia bacterium]
MNRDDTINRIVEQFSKTAEVYTQSQVLHAGLDKIVEFIGVNPSDIVLDVATGPGKIVLEFAKKASNVIGIDITERMLQEAEEAKRRAGIKNVSFEKGDVRALPYAGESFDIVYSGTAFHHFDHPLQVLQEMARVCKRGRKVVINDLISSEEKEKSALHNTIEQIRDPSHVRALQLSEFRELFRICQLEEVRLNIAQRERGFEEWAELAGLTPDDARYRQAKEMMIASIEGDKTGLHVMINGDRVGFIHTSMILVGRKP